jgi:cation diffusion facilitator CzcD-associated flavoprotein CzcO
MAADRSEPVNFDAIIVGAGVGGLYAIYRLRKLALKLHAFESGGDVGGTWYWNRYPG